MKLERTISASTIYEILIAMLIFMSVVFISFYVLYQVNANYEQRNYLKYENLVEEYKQGKTSENNTAWNIEEEMKLYPLSAKFIWKQYRVVASTGDLLFVKNELVLIEE